MKLGPLTLSRAAVVFVHDVLMAPLSFLLSLYLRLGGQAASFFPPADLALILALFALLAGLIFPWQRLHRMAWRFTSLADLTAIVRAVTLLLLVFLPLMFLLTRLELMPRSVLVINWFTMVALLGGPRVLYRLAKDRDADQRIRHETREPVLLVGQRDAAALFVQAARRGVAGPYRVLGILSDHASHVGREIQGVAVLGTVADLDAAVSRLAAAGEPPRHLVAVGEGGDLRALFDAADRLGMTLLRMPRPVEIQRGGRPDPRPIRLEDLLGRPQANLDRASMRTMIEGRRVLVTGAGGSIGSELVRQVADFGPAELVLTENSEFALYTIDREMAERFPRQARRSLIADVRDEVRVRTLFDEVRPDLVFHAAALKHVPIVEENPLEGILTNAVGTRIVADACRASGVQAMVLISTDKVVNPTSVMGATKRVAESYCQTLDLATRAAGGTRFITVRFGNVLGSTGSVVPLFERQLKAGGPLTVTHPEVVRYFMTIHEAVELVLQASAIGLADAGWLGKIFVLDMGAPVRIADLARQMIRLAGLRVEDVGIEFTGLRPGEKLFEEIFHGAEPPLRTRHDGLLVAAPRPVDAGFLADAFDDLMAAGKAGDEAAALAVLRRLVPEYQPPGPANDAAAPVTAP